MRSQLQVEKSPLALEKLTPFEGSPADRRILLLTSSRACTGFFMKGVNYSYPKIMASPTFPHETTSGLK
uniref:Uncharacterized protein n=1 Tax=Physcomitrium patens TaxID=3218 RepID=A0A2K1IR07_PHYPA|nr:hypothetical protein PHYPA_025819 [Physcomitrium patens]